MIMKFDILTLYPEMYSSLNHGVVGKAISDGKFEVNIVDIRDFSTDKHRKVDDYPFGGGAGMVLQCQPCFDAVNSVDKEHTAHRVLMSPRGKTLNQKIVTELAAHEHILLISASFEGIDERFIELCIDEEISIGDYVLTSGDLASAVVVNAVSRYLDGVLGSSSSVDEESFASGLLEYPQYTRPQVFEGLAVPEVLVGGNHKLIDEWRRQQQLEITKIRRPDLYEEYLKQKEDK